VATVVFSHPPIGTVGLTEPAAVEAFGAAAVKCRGTRFPSMLFAFNQPDRKASPARTHLPEFLCSVCIFIQMKIRTTLL
jgi:hypothetical protein